jgi:flagellar hook-associated protein 1 FlgK
MPSLEGLLNIARSAIAAHRAAIDIAGHNIANAETDGYTRQRIALTAGVPATSTFGVFGTGVTVATVERTRDTLLDEQVREQAARSADASTRSDMLGRIESVFGEPSTNGLASALDAFWNSWSELATSPSSSTAKIGVQQAGAIVALTFNRYATGLSDLETAIRGEVSGVVTQVNQLAAQIAAVNARIAVTEAGGHSANDLRDERDRLLDRLSQLVPITVIAQSNGSNRVTIGGLGLIDGAMAKSLALGSGTPLTVTIGGGPDNLRLSGGKLAALLDVANTDLPAARSALDALAASLINEVNALHVTGWSPPFGAAGNWNPATPPTGSGIEFFDTTPANGDARNIRLSATIAANAQAIASSAALNAPGDNAVASAIAGLRDFAATAPGNSFGGGYRALIASVANGKAAAAKSAQVYDTLASQAATRRASADGVSIDEELVGLISHQQAYGAASKIIQAVDEMMQTLLDAKR